MARNRNHTPMRRSSAAAASLSPPPAPASPSASSPRATRRAPRHRARRSSRRSGIRWTATASSPSTSSAPRWASMSARRWRASSPTSSKRRGRMCASTTSTRDPKWGLMVTGGSWSVWQSYPLYSQAGAAGRIALIEAGAKALGVDPATCTAAMARSSRARRRSSMPTSSARAGSTKTYTPEELAKIALKPVADRKLIGKPVTSLDVVEKTNGTAIYGIDAKVDGMVYGCPILPPTRNGSQVNYVIDAPAKDIKGYIQTVVLEGPVEHRARLGDGDRRLLARREEGGRGRHGRAIRLDRQPTSPRRTSRITPPKLIANANSGLGSAARQHQHGAASSRAARSSIEATYTTATALHFQMEPLNALAFEKDGKWEIHTGNQWQSLVLPWLATALGVPETNIVMHTYRLGGGFGRRLNGDYAVGAALASQGHRQAGEDDHDARGRCRSSTACARLRCRSCSMAFDKDGNVTGMEHHVAAGWPTEVMAPFFMPKGEKDVPFDPFAINGANHWYTRGRPQGAGDLQRPRQPDLPSRLAAFGRPGLHQLGAGKLHRRGGAQAEDRSGRVPPEAAQGRRRQCRNRAQLGRRRLAPGQCGEARRRESRLGRTASGRHGPRPCDLVRPGTRHADLGGLRRARQCRSRHPAR